MPEVTYSGQNVVALVLWLVLYLAVFGGVGAYIGRRSGQPIFGFLIGMIFGPIGWIVIALIGRRMMDRAAEDEAARQRGPFDVP